MKKKENMEEWFESFKDQWDAEEPSAGHQQRFMEKLSQPKKKRIPYATIISIAASIIILLGVFINHEAPGKTKLAGLSPEAKETQLYFSGIIKKELASLKKENAPESRQILNDALFQMSALENDYQKLAAELAEKGENEQIIHAMITNLQTRISFLEKVETQIENIKKLKANYHEKNNL